MLTATINDKKLVIEIDIDPQISKTGKSLVLASTHGNVPTKCEYEGKLVVIGLNAYVKR
jgi:hypothetical protein